MTYTDNSDPYLSQLPAPRSTERSTKGPALLIAASVLVIGGVIAAAVMVGDDDDSPTQATTAPPLTELPDDLVLPNFDVWTFDVGGEWRDVSVGDYRQMDPAEASTFAGSWNVDGRVNAKALAFIYVHQYEITDFPDETIEDVVAEFDMSTGYWETAPFVSDEFFESDYGIAGWVAHGEGICDQGEQCAYATFLFKDGVNELWVAAYDFDPDTDYIDAITQVMHTVRLTAP